MGRVLRWQDLVFLRAQPGYLPGIERTLRRERKRIFRTLLRKLAIDFFRLRAIALRKIAYSSEPEVRLAVFLWKQEGLFIFGFLSLRVRCELYGLVESPVDVAPLLERLGALLEYARSLPTPAQLIETA